MFVLKKLYIEDHSKIILDVPFSDDTFQKATSKNDNQPRICCAIEEIAS